MADINNGPNKLNDSEPHTERRMLLAFLLMGAFVTVYNLLSFRLLGDPYRLPASVVSLLFLTYLVGTLVGQLL